MEVVALRPSDCASDIAAKRHERLLFENVQRDDDELVKKTT